MEVAVVVDPAANEWAEHPRQIIQALVAASLKGPELNGFAEFIQRGLARRRQERHAVFPVGPFCQPRLECVAEEIERHDRVDTGSMPVLAVDDLRLLRFLRMQP